MKYFSIVYLVLFCALHSFSQKKKQIPKPTLNLIAKADPAKAAIIKDNLYFFILNKTVNDTIFIKKMDAILPIDAAITPFNANGTKLYLLTWAEKSTTKTNLKSEDKTLKYFYILEENTSKIVFSNIQLTNIIIEKVFLDQNKNASETQTRSRKEGFECILNPDGTITQKTTKQVNILKYNAVTSSFVSSNKK
ncbi:hypothetical protein FLBR109950_04615 [Flavobacterium branchiophilum]|uniref:Uncharacterized protein n=2 Tax=Flavobacterium branchiophilum TaxID=55197 RepID=G2Z1U5_FLABF|nr:hypothetical protein [Flavobacterium branchiophilum]PDS22743.1 hypothetical protein B0A77_12550 [Flavobacterium branchiophilum]CCB69883.1 Hypothetical protein precursor [Flavobacterium branchiophilum FL-15]